MPENGLSERGRTLSNIFAVITLYKMQPDESVTFTTLTAEMSKLRQDAPRLHVLLYDNTPGGQCRAQLPEYVLYRAAEHNEGVAGSYNCALSLACRGGFTWLLTLDQDTQLPPDFLARMQELALRLEPNEEIGTIVPQLSHAGRSLSPVRVWPWGVRYPPCGFTGIARGEIHALNSASLFRVKALSEIGGFDPRFWLDYQDYFVFRQLHRHGKRVWVAGEIKVEHDLSLISKQRSMGVDRYRNFLDAESAFCDLYRGYVAGLALSGRLAARAWRQWRQMTNASIRQLTVNALKRRIFVPRIQRIHEWQNKMQQRMQAPPEQGCQLRPSISICMAVYNGSNFIAEQIASILPQLGPQNEFVIVDDASRDNTISIIEGFHDERIRIIRNERNRGVVQSFGRALEAATGEIIFLTDHDDVWRADKVEKFLQMFDANPSITVVMSDLVIIDATGKIISEPKFGSQKFHPGAFRNLISNRYQGSAMAFRRSILESCLPFPSDIPIHDVWIGLVNQFVGKAGFIPEPLLLYRRHGGNDSPDKHAPLMQMLRWRWALMKNVTWFYMRKMAKSDRVRNISSESDDRPEMIGKQRRNRV